MFSYIDVADSADDCDWNGPENAQEPDERCTNDVHCLGFGEWLDSVLPQLRTISIWANFIIGDRLTISSG